ncbi:Replication factor A protein 2 [Umbelopsis nana]
MSGYDNYGYDAMSGVENTGGGFLESSNYDNQGGNHSQGNKTKASEQTLRPVTIKQMLNSQQSHGESEFKIDNVDVTQVTFVAVVRGISEQSTNISYTVEDGTGSIDVRKWADQNEQSTDGERQKISQIISGNYVRIVGRLTQFNQKTHIVAFNIRPIKDANEITHHFLEAIMTHLQFTKGRSHGNGNSMDTFSNSAYNAGNFTNNSNQSGNRGIHGDVIDVINQFKHLDQGAEINQVVTRLQGKYSESQVRESLDFLQNEGHLYATIDEFHVKSAESF